MFSTAAYSSAAAIAGVTFTGGLGVVTGLGIVFALVAVFAGIYVQLRSAGETRAKELWQEEAEALRARNKTQDEDLIAERAKCAALKTANDVLSNQVTNTQTIREVEQRITDRIDTVQAVVINAIEKAVVSA